MCLPLIECEKTQICMFENDCWLNAGKKIKSDVDQKLQSNE